MANLNIAIEIFANDKASGPLGRITSSLGNLAGTGLGGLQAAGAVALGAVTAGAVAVGGAVALIGRSAVGAAASMDQNMANIAAVMGRTREEIAPLSDLIRDLGLDPNLKVTADEAAAAIEMLARNGLDMTQILDGAAKSTVLLANSTGTDLGNAANIATDAMAIFGIEAGNMMSAVDGIVAVTTNSKFTIDDFALALAQGGGVASAAGVEFDDFNTSIAAISPLFKSGSDAGTSFKTFLQRLIPASSAADEAMAELGLITEEGANQFFDAQGNLKDMAEIAGLLQTSLSGLSEEQRNNALSTIFGTDAMRAAVGLMETGADGFQELAAAMAETDAAESAATRMDTLSGVLEILQGIGEGLMLTLGQGLLPILRLFADRALELADQILPRLEPLMTGFSTAISNFVSRMETGAPLLGNFTGLILQLGGVFGLTSQQSQGLAEFLNTLNNSILPGLQQQFRSVLGPIIEWISNNVELGDVLTALGIAIAAVVIPAIISIVAAIAPVVLAFGAVVGAVALVRNAWENNWGGIQEKTQAVIDFIVPLVQGAIAGIQAWWAENGDAILAKASEIWTNVQGAISTALTYISDGLRAFFTAVQQFWAAHGETIIAKAKGIWELIKQAIGTALDLITSIWDAWKALFEGDWYTFGQKLFEVWETAWLLIRDFFGGLYDLFKPELDQLWTNISNWWDSIDWGGLGGRIIDRIVGGLRAAGGAILAALRGIIDSAIQNALNGLGGGGNGPSSGASGYSGYGASGYSAGGFSAPLAVAGGQPVMINIDARGAAPGMELIIRQQVEAALRQAGLQADARRRS